MSRNTTVEGPDPIDIAVGLNVRHVRRAKGVSQDELARATGTTFQQVQKYEQGKNRISASRLVRIARTLGVKAASLLPADDAPELPQSARLLAQVRGLDEVSELYQRLTPRQRRALIDFLKSLTGEAEP